MNGCACLFLGVNDFVRIFILLSQCQHCEPIKIICQWWKFFLKAYTPLISLIFWPQFLPDSSDSTLVTGAADCKIRVHDLVAQETTRVYSCHVGRVKRIAVAPSLPYIFWSASEDGCIMWVKMSVFFYVVSGKEACLCTICRCQA